MEYASHGNLRNFLRCHRLTTPSQPGARHVTSLTTNQLLSFCYQVAAGMQHLASLKVSPPNCSCKFGLS